MKIRVYILFVLIVVLTACTAPATPVIPTSIPSSTSTQTPSPVPTLAPTQTATPTATGIPGFEDWSVLGRNAVDIQTDGDALVLTLTRRALWFMDERGVFMYKPVTGDFRITARIHTSKLSDPTQRPGGDGTVQLGGLMVRAGQGGGENYVFIVAGDDGDGTSVETKNTVDSRSRYDGPDWDSPDAELRICRLGTTFTLYKRHLDTNENWIAAATLERADMPETVQVGVNIYSNSEPDLQIRYENISIEPISDAADCETR